MKGATHHTPGPNGMSIAELVVPRNDESPLIPTNPKKVLHEGQDVHNECMDVWMQGMPMLRKFSIHDNDD
jgi:hypothetical protein